MREMALFAGDPRYHFNSASLFAHNSSASLQFVRAWKSACEREASTAFQDQKALYALLQNRSSLRFMPMPVAYCKVYDLDQFFLDDADVVIEQAQASRVHKSFFETGPLC